MGTVRLLSKKAILPALERLQLHGQEMGTPVQIQLMLRLNLVSGQRLNAILPHMTTTYSNTTSKISHPEQVQQKIPYQGIPQVSVQLRLG